MNQRVEGSIPLGSGPPAGAAPLEPPVGGAASPGLLAPQALLEYLGARRGELIAEWVDAAARLGPHYRRRSTAELQSTISQSFDANLAAMTLGSTRPLDQFVAYITRLRLQAGFPLSEVQKAFDLFRTLLLPRILRPELAPWAAGALEAVNACVSYQIHSFSDQFQAMHQAAMADHADQLEQKVIERSRELDLSRRRYQTLVEEINDGYFAVDRGRIALANRAFCSMHRLPPHRIQSRNFLRFVAPSHRERVAEAYRQTLNGRFEGKVVEYLRLAGDGTTSETEIRARVVDLGEGPVLIGICRDISARAAMERKVREHERLAYVGHLAASLSHEIRNPLSIIKMSLQVLERRLRPGGADGDRLAMAVSEVSRLERVLYQLLDLSKPLLPQPKEHQVNQVTADCLDLLAPKLAERGLRLRRRLDPGLPRLRVDRAMLEQALINLLFNAMEATPDGGHITVTTQALDEAAGRGCRLTVRDNGMGLDPEALAKVFTPFFTTKPQGTGLGLTNVKRIAEAHDGRVAVESRPGRGAKFTLDIWAMP